MKKFLPLEPMEQVEKMNFFYSGHAIKHFAKYRSLVNGRLSADGIKDYLTLLSIYQTCNYKGINFLDFLLSKEKDIDKFQAKR